MNSSEFEGPAEMFQKGKTQIQMTVKRDPSYSMSSYNPFRARRKVAGFIVVEIANWTAMIFIKVDKQNGYNVIYFLFNNVICAQGGSDSTVKIMLYYNTHNVEWVHIGIYFPN